MQATRRSSVYFGMFFLAVLTAPGHALEFEYAGEFTLCSATCDSFAALGAQSGGSSNGTNSSVTGIIDLPIRGDNTFEFSQQSGVIFNFSFSNAAVAAQAPIIGPAASCPAPNAPGQICNAFTANPLPLDSLVARVSGSGEIGDNGLPQNGTLIFTWDHPPLSSNGIELRIDLSSGSGDTTLFGGALDFFGFDGAFSISDEDGDGVANATDNCLEQPNSAQRDTDGDGYGNRCDSDLNNDCIANFLDLGLFRNVFFSDDADADFNGDGTVNFLDLGILRSGFFQPPGPSAQTLECDSI